MGTKLQTRKRKPYVLGLSIGTFWLIAAGAGGAFFAIVEMANARTLLFVVLVIAGALLGTSIRYIMSALKLPSEPSPQDRRIGPRFALIFILEGVAIGLVSSACYFVGHRSWILPLSLIIVGIHFMPLAKLFGVPRYMTLGWLFCIVSVLTLVLVPAHSHVGTYFAQYVYSSLGCAASAWLISVGNLLELRRVMQNEESKHSFDR